MAISTVSPTYAREIQTPEHGFGLDGLLRARSSALSGIVNGADYSEWSPEHDHYIASNFSVEDLSGKLVCKEDLLQTFGLPMEDLDKPLIGIVSRFASQKGFDLLEAVVEDILTDDVCMVALGTGEPHYEWLMRGLAERYPGRVSVRVAYDNALAHKIEAGSDMFLMPSRYEPGGLNQIFSLRYGTVPIVRATGGLDDTVDEGRASSSTTIGPCSARGGPDRAGGLFRSEEVARDDGDRDAPRLFVERIRGGIQRSVPPDCGGLNPSGAFQHPYTGEQQTMAGVNTLEFSDASFDQDVLNSEVPVLVDFWAEWCGPCRQMSPTIDAIASDYAGKVKVGKLNVDHNNGTAARYAVRSIPTLLLFKGGRVVEQRVGNAPKTELQKMLDPHVTVAS